jgi:bla regulator protein BlaR1
MITYLIKTVACSAVFLLVYLVFLEREKMHRFNRWYLLGSIVLSFIIPLVKVQGTQEILPVLNDAYIINWEPGNIVATPAEPIKSSIPATQTVQPANSFKIPIWILMYGLVTLILLVRFARNIYRLATACWNREIIRYQGIPLVILRGDISSYTFFNTIFISEADFPADGRGSAILTHELAHVRQKHSWDVLFIELIKALCWFNPLFIFYKKAIQLNHEFLADEAVIIDRTDIHTYQCLLLDKISQGTPINFTSSFNYSITKKRLIMMTKRYNAPISILKKAMIFPLLTIVVFVFGSKQITTKESMVKQLDPINDTIVKKDTTPSKSYYLRGNAKPSDTTWKWRAHIFPFDPPPTKEGATKEEMDEYNAFIDHNLKTAGKEYTMRVNPAEKERLLIIFNKMNIQQRMDNKVGFQRKWDPPKKLVPTQAQMEKWKNPADYGVWIGDRKINNKELDNYKPSDFSYYSASNLRYSEKAKQNVMARYNLKVMYKVQLNLFTNADYESWVKRSAAEPLYSMYYRITNDPSRKGEVEYRYPVQE